MCRVAGKPGYVREFDIGQGKVREIVVCLWCATADAISHKINITRVLLSKVDMHKMDCQYCHNIHSGVHVGLSVYTSGGLININDSVRNTWKSPRI